MRIAAAATPSGVRLDRIAAAAMRCRRFPHVRCSGCNAYVRCVPHALQRLQRVGGIPDSALQRLQRTGSVSLERVAAGVVRMEGLGEVNSSVSPPARPSLSPLRGRRRPRGSAVRGAVRRVLDPLGPASTPPRPLRDAETIGPAGWCAPGHDHVAAPRPVWRALATGRDASSTANRAGLRHGGAIGAHASRSGTLTRAGRRWHARSHELRPGPDRGRSALDAPIDERWRPARRRGGSTATGWPTARGREAGPQPGDRGGRGGREALIEDCCKRYPEAGVPGQETAARARAEAGLRWVVDPIDGTRAFIRGIPTWSILLGLEADGRAGARRRQHARGGRPLLRRGGAKAPWGNGRPLSLLGTSNRCGQHHHPRCALAVHRLAARPPLPRLGEGTYTQRGFSDFDGYRQLLLGRVDAMIDPASPPGTSAPRPSSSAKRAASSPI